MINKNKDNKSVPLPKSQKKNKKLIIGVIHGIEIEVIPGIPKDRVK